MVVGAAESFLRGVTVQTDFRIRALFQNAYIQAKDEGVQRGDYIARRLSLHDVGI